MSRSHLESVEEHRETLEDLAQSNLPCAEIAEELLEATNTRVTS